MSEQQDTPLKAYVFRLHPGEDLREALERKIKANHLEAAAIITCVGSVQRITLRLANESLYGPAEGPFEIVSLVGTLGQGGSHLHAKGNVIGGHIRAGCTIHTTAEIVLAVLPTLTFERTFDPKTGFDELDIR